MKNVQCTISVLSIKAGPAFSDDWVSASTGLLLSAHVQNSLVHSTFTPEAMKHVGNETQTALFSTNHVLFHHVVDSITLHDDSLMLQIATTFHRWKLMSTETSLNGLWAIHGHWCQSNQQVIDIWGWLSFQKRSFAPGSLLTSTVSASWLKSDLDKIFGFQLNGTHCCFLFLLLLLLAASDMLFTPCATETQWINVDVLSHNEFVGPPGAIA